MSALDFFRSLRRRSLFPRRNSLSLCSCDNRLSRHTRLRLEALEARVMLDAEANALIGVDRLRAEANVPEDQYYGIDGSGYSIVVLDSGIDLDHPFFGPDDNGDNISDRIVFHKDFTVCKPNDPDFMGCVPVPEHVDDLERLDRQPGQLGALGGHGTLVASIAAGYHPGGGGLPAYSGVAPGANIIALKVLPDENSNPEFENDIVKGVSVATQRALQWVKDNRLAYNIATVNMSFRSDGAIYEAHSAADVAVEQQKIQQSLPGQAFYEKLEALEAAGVLLVASAGNGYNGERGITFPGADTPSLSVGMVWDTPITTPVDFGNSMAFSADPDHIVSSSRRDLFMLDALAPGAFIGGARAGGNNPGGFVDTPTTDNTGTSFASPHIAGVAVLAKQMRDMFGGENLFNLDKPATPGVPATTGFKTLVRETGVPVVDGDDEDVSVDPVSEDPFTTFPRINLVGDAAADELSGLANILVPPRVKQVTISSTTNSRFYNVPGLNGTTGVSEQLRTVAVPAADKITLKFTEPVTGLNALDLTLTGLDTGTNYSIQSSTAIPGLVTDFATWTFENVFATDRIQLVLTDSLTDVFDAGISLAPNHLNGGWVNATSLSDPNGSAFPSGDNVPGGSFTFVFTILPGDIDRNNVVDIVDYNTVVNNFGMVTIQWILGEMSGDGRVWLEDRNFVTNNFGKDFSTYGGQQMAMGGGGGGSVAIVATGYEAFITFLADLYATYTKQEKNAAHDAFWSAVAEDKEVWTDLMAATDVN